MEFKSITIREYRAKLAHYHRLIEKGYPVEVNGLLLGNNRIFDQKSVDTGVKSEATGDTDLPYRCDKCSALSPKVDINKSGYTEEKSGYTDPKSVVPLEEEEEYEEEELEDTCQVCKEYFPWSKLAINWHDRDGEMIRVCVKCFTFGMRTSYNQAKPQWERLERFEGMMP